MADAAVRTQPLERVDRLGEGNAARPVQQIAVEVVETESLQAALARSEGAARTGVLRIDLADDEQVVARDRALAQCGGERLAHDLLGAAFAVHLGGVDDAPADLERGANRRDLALPARRRLADVPSAQAER